MLSCRSHLTALAAATAFAVAIPTAGASAARTKAPTPTVDPQVCQLMDPSAMGLFGPAEFMGGGSLTTTLAHAGATVGCPAPAAQPSPMLPIFP
jgi:hypothetical protein